MEIGDVVEWCVYGTLSVRTVEILAWLPSGRAKVRVLKIDGTKTLRQFIAYAGRSRLRAILEDRK